MNKKIMFFTIFFLLFCASTVMSLEIIVPETSIAIYADESNELDIPIKNDGNITDTFYFSIWPTEWVSIDKYWVNLNVGETGQISFIVKPPIDVNEGTVKFTITVTSSTTKETFSEDIYLDIKQKTKKDEKSPVFEDGINEFYYVDFII